VKRISPATEPRPRSSFRPASGSCSSQYWKLAFCWDVLRSSLNRMNDASTDSLVPLGLTAEHVFKKIRRLEGSRGIANTKIKTPIAVLFFLLLFTPANLRADGWVLMTPDFTVTETEVTPTKKWVVLESFPTVLQCNDRRSSSIRYIDKERREILAVDNHTAAIETNRELRLLLHIYASSKCVSSR
jgi:hypothetical protein